MKDIDQTYTAIGVMSGTSLDGLDLVCCKFHCRDHKWSFEILASDSIPYSAFWKNLLSQAFYSGISEVEQLHIKYGHYIADQLNVFIRTYQLRPDVISSHGHTIFHAPEKGITLQIGDGKIIANKTGIITINNFRALDVSKGGQGAPLVPIGDHLLFSAYEICLNIGGIANVSFVKDGKRVAFDVGPANQVLNYLAHKIGLDFDNDGEIAKTGTIDVNLLNAFNELDYYSKSYPKSLGREWVDSVFIPLLNLSKSNISSLLRTTTEHIALQIHKAIREIPASHLLATGGGALNNFLISRLQAHSIHKIVVPSRQVIEFKEAIVFAFLGLLRFRNEINCFASVTGASEDSSSGDIHLVQS
ncbi:MAG: anhydro-N-acetylmuramic acid kinase [Bacteroidetes bacterium HGW-Bacteroidetes-1]|jgi:anhydro-N-acetylmuramic acid kinase|nr:MAG: anhydro-N-acetylmuramic acid kinase [Bacteroidetes bacterium HGW-Bacteroidetes-1]